VEESFRKDLSHITWDEVFARQVQRAALVEDWLTAIGVKPGDRVLDVGAGPGYVSLVVADRVGPDGLVYAVDRSSEALAYLERLQGERGVSQIRRVVADAATLQPGSLDGVDAALITMILHHTDDPARLLGNVARLMPGGALGAVAEFHPEGPCLVGPPQRVRVTPEQVRDWCEAAGLLPLAYRRQTPEHYVWIVQRRRDEPESGRSTLGPAGADHAAPAAHVRAYQEGGRAERLLFGLVAAIHGMPLSEPGEAFWDRMREQIKMKVRAPRSPWLDGARKLFTQAVEVAYAEITAAEQRIAVAAAGNA